MTHAPIKLTIITVTYRQPVALAHTLDSLKGLATASFSWELIVVDSSPEVNAAALGKCSLPVRHILQPPTGIYPAMNEGIRQSKGAFIWFLNGGDELASKEALEDAIRELETNPAASLLLAAAELMRQGRVRKIQRPHYGLIPMLGINRVCHQAIVYRRNLFDLLGSFLEKYRLAADYELHLRTLAIGISTIEFSKVLVRYDQGGQSSDPSRVFADFKLVQTDLAEAGLLPGAWLHGPVRWAERARIRLLQKLR